MSHQQQEQQPDDDGCQGALKGSHVPETDPSSECQPASFDIPELNNLTIKGNNEEPSHRHSLLTAEAETTISRYKYRALAPREIRLIRILPGKNDEEEIEGNIITSSLDNGLPFVALSYVWAYDDTKMRQFIERWNVKVVKAEEPHLKTPKGSVLITPSLRAALNSARSVRRKKEQEKDFYGTYQHPLYWADAICS